MRSKLLFIILLALLITAVPVMGSCGEGTQTISTYTPPQTTIGAGAGEGTVTPSSSGIPEELTPPPGCISQEEASEATYHYYSETYGVPREDVEIMPGALYYYELTDVYVWVFKVFAKKAPDQMIAVDCNGNIVDWEQVKAAEQTAERMKFGKLAPDLYDLLQTRGPDDPVRVEVFVAGGESFDAIAQRIIDKYPEAHLEPGVVRSKDTPWELYVQIWQEYEDALEQEKFRVIQPMLELLASLGYEAAPSSGPWARSVLSTLPKSVILEVADGEEVTVVYSKEIGNYKVGPGLSTAAPTLYAPSAWIEESQGWCGRKGYCPASQE